MRALKKLTYSPRISPTDLKKPVVYPGTTHIKGTPRMMTTIDRMCPNEGNRRRESLLLGRIWTEKMKRQSAPKSEVIALAAQRLQTTGKKFEDQVRKNGGTVTGLARAKCTMSKTCYWMIQEGLFVVVKGAA
jgi:hypothetical protein